MSTIPMFTNLEEKLPTSTTSNHDVQAMLEQKNNDNGTSSSPTNQTSNHNRKHENNKRTRSYIVDQTDDDDEGNKEEQQTKEEPKAKRRRKAKKPMDMPRRALSAYNIFFSEQRKIILDEITRKEQELHHPAYASSSDSEGDHTETDSLQILTGNFQRRNPLPDVIPCVYKERRSIMTRTKRLHRKVHGKISMVVLAREVSKRWKQLSAGDRKYYDDLAEEDKIRHKEAMNNYKQRKAAEYIQNSSLMQKQDYSLHSTISQLSMDGVTMNDNHLYSFQQNQFQRRQQQEEVRHQRYLDMIRSAPTLNPYQEAIVMEQQRQQVNRNTMFNNLVAGGGGIAYGGPTFGIATPQPVQIPSASTLHTRQSSLIPLTNLERRMIMKCRAAGEAASKKTMIELVSSQAYQNGSSINCYRRLNSTLTARSA